MQNEYDVIVVGGGLAGISAALSAARLGCRVALVQDRPVLGGNSSSEVKVGIGGAADFNPWARETGILEEFVLEDRSRNHRLSCNGYIGRIWDLILYERCQEEGNLDLFLNTSARKSLFASGQKERCVEEIECIQIGSR